MTARHVMHDGERWQVAGNSDLDGAPAYWLQRRRPGMPPIRVFARITDCEPVTVERKRRFRSDDGVIEFDGRGNITLRERGRRKRYTTTIKGLIWMAARHEAATKQREKAFARRTGKRGRKS